MDIFKERAVREIVKELEQLKHDNEAIMNNAIRFGFHRSDDSHKWLRKRLLYLNLIQSLKSDSND